MGDIEDTTDARRTVHQHCMNGLMRLVRFAKFGNATVIKRHNSPQYHNVQRKKEAGAPAEKPVLLHHAQTQGYIAIRDNKVVCIPLQSDDPTFHMVVAVYYGQEMSPESAHYNDPVVVLAFHQPETLISTSSRALYLCASDNVKMTVEPQPLSVQPMSECRLTLLPSDTSPQFFYEIPAASDDKCFCLESTSKQGNFVWVEGSRVFLKNTTTDDVKAHFICEPFS